MDPGAGVSQGTAVMIVRLLALETAIWLCCRSTAEGLNLAVSHETSDSLFVILRSGRVKRNPSVTQSLRPCSTFTICRRAR